MANEIFYPPPQPTQRTRYAPIPAQGQQPPKFTLHGTMALVLASWPTGLEHPPVQRTRYVPIPAQGQQPPRTTIHGQMNETLASWPTGFEHPAWQRIRYTPIPAQGRQPPNYAGELLDFINALRLYDPPDPQPRQRPITAPIPAQGDQPPSYSAAPYYQLIDSWRPPDPAPWQRPLTVAPLTLTYGQQPPKRTLFQFFQLIDAWRAPDPQPRQLPLTSAPLTLTYGDQPPSYSVAPYYQLIDAWRPPPPEPKQLPLTVAPLTLVYGQQPPVTSGARDPDIYNTTLGVAWIPPDPLPTIPQRRFVAPLTLTYGQQPPRSNPALFFQLIDSWRAPDPAPKQLPLTSAPLTLSYGDQPPKYNPAQMFSLIEAWRPPPPEPRQLPLKEAPLTLVYGQQPPPLRSVNFRGAAAWAPVEFTFQRASAVVPVVAGTLLIGLVAAWELNEASGNALDSFDSEVLTDHGGVTTAAGLVYSTARHFASQYFARSDDAGLSAGDTDFTFEVWFKLDTTGAVRTLISKHNGATAAGSEYLLSVQGTTLQWELYSGGSSIARAAATFGAVPTGTWIQVIAWHDSVNNVIGIAVNAGAADTSAWSSGVNDTTTDFGLGATQGGSNGFDGSIGPARFWRKVLSGAERTQLYNAGAGLPFSSFGGSTPAATPLFASRVNFQTIAAAWAPTWYSVVRQFRGAPLFGSVTGGLLLLRRRRGAAC